MGKIMVTINWNDVPCITEDGWVVVLKETHLPRNPDVTDYWVSYFNFSEKKHTVSRVNFNFESKNWCWDDGEICTMKVLAYQPFFKPNPYDSFSSF